MEGEMFSGLNFYFYPPRTSRLNKVRSTAAAKRGATITTTPSDQLTHVLVARGGETPEFWKLISNIPPECAIVNSDWCSECIDQNRIVPTDVFAVKKVAVKLAEINKQDPEQIEVSPAKRAHRENAVDSPSQSPSPSSVVASHSSIHFSISPLDKQLNYKQVILDMFNEFAQARRSAGEEFSAKAYDRALQSLETHKGPIHCGEDVEALPGLTTRMAQLVDEICTGKITHRVTASTMERTRVTTMFCTVYGVGPYNARKLYDRGFRTLQHIRPEVDFNGKVSIDHHEDLVERMSRAEVSIHYERVREIAHEIDSELMIYVMGSYRRGKLDCGDIDIIVTEEGLSLDTLNEILDTILAQLFSTGMAVHTFGRGTDRWLGATQVYGKWRRMDILLVPPEEIGSALLYYTGSDAFNRAMRWHAKQNGMRLNHNGLFVDHEDKSKRLLLESKDERRIFDLLKLQWREPEKRTH